MAPAFCIQMLLMLFTGMVINSVSLGIVIGIVLAISSYAFFMFKNRSWSILHSKMKDCYPEFVLAVIVYLLIYTINMGKHYHSVDEFMHWGNFLRETYRLDALYVTSPAPFYHKDYVPAITLFEALWCKLSLRLSEANAYRGIQMLQVSMLLPMITRTVRREEHIKPISVAVKTFITLTIPLFFSGLLFYHTIYQDYIYGVLVFYCMWIVITGERTIYTLFEATLAMTILILSKMTALAFLPMIVIFYAVYMIFYQESVRVSHTVSKVIGASAVLTFIPLATWKMYNVYAQTFLGKSSGGQSYGAHGISSLLIVLAHDGTIAWQNDVEKSYLSALISRGLVSRIPYVQLILLIVALLLLYSYMGEKRDYIRKIRISALWIFLAGLAYGFLMYYLYMTGFSEYEARELASYDRYMGTFAISAVFLAVAIVFYFSKEKTIVIPAIGIVFLQNAFFFLDYDQIIPGILSGDKALYLNEANHICNIVPEDKTVAVVIRGENVIAEDAVNYYGYPREMGFAYPGKATSEEDTLSREYSCEELTKWIISYDYVYFMNIDNAFIGEYSGIFANPEDVVRGEIYKVSYDGGKIITY
ncbi:hypothetical protein [Butyrivibrio hungatei]|nr:hypothetical protein [Butyrivibrio hungatei]